MSLDNYKITQNDIETKGVVAAPDVVTGDPKETKKLFDRLIREAVAVQFNAMVDALTASSGAGEIGAAVDGIAAGTVLGVLSALKVLHDTTEQTQGATNESVQAALGNRYTKDQTDALLQGKLDTVTANQMVRAIEFNAETGVFTITTQGGAVSTIDTMLERVPASFTLENNQLVLTLEDGTRQTADLSAFIDIYTFSSGGTVAFSQNGKTITAEVRDGSLALSKLTPEAQATLASYASRAEAAKESAEAARAGAEVARDAAQRAAATAEEKASAAAGSASAAGNHASNAAGSATAAQQSETNAKDSETAAKEAQEAAEAAAGNAARDAAAEVENRLGDYVDDAEAAKDAAEKARDEAQNIAGGDFMTPAVYDPKGKKQDVFAYADAVFSKVISMGEQLVVNGNAMLGNNRGFSAWTFDGTQANNSVGSFVRSTGGLIFADDYFSVDTRKDYKISMDMKSKDGVENILSFVAMFDADKKEIKLYHTWCYTPSLTKLTKDLVAGDTWAYVEDVAAWNPNFANARRISVWNYKNSFGQEYAPGYYTRNQIDMYHVGASPTEEAFDRTNNAIRLKSAYTGETIPAGTWVSQGYAGDNYPYAPNIGDVPAEWTHYEGEILSSSWRNATCFCKIGFYWNNNGTADTTWMTNVSLRSIEDSPVDPTKLTDPVPIEKGGTGAASAEEARTALNVPSVEEMDEAIANAIGKALEANY